LALTPPTTNEFLRFLGADSWSTNYPEEVLAEDQLQAATDLMEIATRGCLDGTDPEDELEIRVMKRGIMQMAQALSIYSSGAQKALSPFQSETIGGYSYTKAEGFILGGTMTGIPYFDSALGILLDGCDGQGTVSSQSEYVFPKPYDPNYPAPDPLGSLF
jgi:hypothetical protein